MVRKNKYLSDTGHLKEEYISLFVDAHLLNKVNKLPQEILEHVEDCQVCKQNIIEGYDLNKKMDNIKLEDHPYFNSINSESIHLKKTNFSILYKIAASILFMVSISVAGYYFLNNTQKKINKIAETDTILIDSLKEENALTDSLNLKDTINKTLEIEIEDPKKEIELNELIAENRLEGEEFQVSPIMLSMIGTTARSDFFEVETPQDSAILENKQVISFTWKSDVEEEIKLKIFNYKNELVFESKTLMEDKLTVEEALLPGAYIWKIESKDEMYHLGLFFIAK